VGSGGGVGGAVGCGGKASGKAFGVKAGEKVTSRRKGGEKTLQIWVTGRKREYKEEKRGSNVVC
jgi:hypothetical protein